jgi:hypothetical protein
MPTIRKANVQDISLVAQIHFKSLPDDFFPSLGLDFLETVYYPASLKSEHAATLVTEAQDEVSGFVTVATDSSLYNRDILRRAWINLYQTRSDSLRNCFHCYRSTLPLQRPWERAGALRHGFP